MDRRLDRARGRRAAGRVHGTGPRLPYNSDPTLRAQINDGEVEYVDTHLSHSAQHMWFGFYGNLDVAVVEVAAILPDGLLVPGSSVGNNKTWLDRADKVILEVNHWQPRDLEGFHDIYYGTALPPYRAPIQLTEPLQRIGEPVPARRPRQGGRGGRDERARPQHPAQPAGRRPRPRWPTMLSTSCATRSAAAGCRRSCCRCSPASATSPTP